MRSKAWIAAALVASLIGGTVELARAGDGDGKQQRPAKSIDDLIRDLGDDEFKTREAATDALAERGAEAVPALEKAAQDKDPEVRWRAEKALKLARAKAGVPAPTPTPATPRPDDQPRSPGATGPRDAHDPMDDVMRELERGMRGGFEDLLKDLRPKDMPEEMKRAFDEMEKSLRELDRGGLAQPGPLAPRDFWTFRLKDGQWQIERGADSPTERIGLRTTPLPPVARAQLVLTDDAIVVEEVKPGSLAEQAGFQRYDIVFSIDGRPTRTDDDLQALESAGEHRIAILRAGKRETLTATLSGDAAPRETPAAPPPGKIRKY